MTTYTILGQHHAKNRKINLNPVVRGGDHARGRTPLTNLKNSIPSLRRYLRRNDRVANTISKKALCSQYFNDALSSLDQLEEPLELEEIYQ